LIPGAIERVFTILTILGDPEPNHLEELNNYSERLTSDFSEIFPGFPHTCVGANHAAEAASTAHARRNIRAEFTRLLWLRRVAAGAPRLGADRRPRNVGDKSSASRSTLQRNW